MGEIVSKVDECQDCNGSEVTLDMDSRPPWATCSSCGSGWEVERPIVVALCGSTRFRAEYAEAFRREEHAGRIALSVPCYKDDPCCKSAEDRRRLDRLHRRKIDLADEIFVVNVGGYVGESTRAEIEYAEAAGKEVRYLEPVI